MLQGERRCRNVVFVGTSVLVMFFHEKDLVLVDLSHHVIIGIYPPSVVTVTIHCILWL